MRNTFLSAMLSVSLLIYGCHRSREVVVDKQAGETDNTQSTLAADWIIADDSAALSQDTDAPEVDDSTNDVACDGDDVDCYAHCRECAWHSDCADEVDACEHNPKCNALLKCRETRCCNGNYFGGDCLDGGEWENCIDDCIIRSAATDDTLSLLKSIDRCIACDACAISCGENTRDFPVCDSSGAGPQSQTPCFSQYPDAEGDDCFTWAISDGPCEAPFNACRSDPGCTALEKCVSVAASADDPVAARRQCLDASDDDTVTRYWEYSGCVFCDACNMSCWYYLRDLFETGCYVYTLTH